MKQRIVLLILLLVLLGAFLVLTGHAAMPEQLEFGSTWNMYLQEPGNSVDVLFFGSSMAYCDVVPAVIYQQTGLTSYVMAGPEQTFSITYPYIREALKTQSPSVIFLEMTGVMYDRYMGFSKVNIGYMPYFTLTRLDATLHGAERTEWTGLFFPLYNYHDRLQEEMELFHPRPDEIQDPMAGYTFLAESEVQKGRAPRQYDTSDEQIAENLSALKKIEAYCEKKGVQLVLYQTPSCAYLSEELLQTVRDAVDDSTIVVDFNADFDSMGLDLNTDFYDALHFNAAGAEKFSTALAEYLASFNLMPSHGDEPMWQDRVTAFYDRLAEVGQGA